MLNRYRYSVGQLQASFHEFRLFGKDVDQFLQKQTTFNLEELPEKNFHLVSFLDPQGRLEAYGWLLRRASDFSFLVPDKWRESASARLEKFLISEEVTIEIPSWEEWLFILGPQSGKFKNERSYSGTLFEEPATLIKSAPVPGVNLLSKDEVEEWRGLNGWPTFDGSLEKKDLINNSRLFDLSVSMNKGCYPGQETVSKIATRRGAAYSPVLVEVEQIFQPGTLYNFEKKIGHATGFYSYGERNFLSCDLLRDFRVEGLKINFTLNDTAGSGTVRYYPLLSGRPEDKAQELYDEANDCFKKNDMVTAEEKLRLSISMDPKFADAYESLGVILGRLERFPEAASMMENLIKIDPTSVLAHTNLSLFLMRMGKIEEAEEHKSLATVKSFQKFGEEAKNKERENEIKRIKYQEWEKRESMFRQVLEIDTEDALANYGIGSILVERGNWKEAIPYLEKVLTIDPGYSVAYLALGRAYKELGNVSKAKEIWTKGVANAAKKGDLMPANQMQAGLDRL